MIYPNYKITIWKQTVDGPEASSSPPVFDRGSRDAQEEQARAGERAAGRHGGRRRGTGPAPPARVGQRADVEQGGPRWGTRPARGRGLTWSGGAYIYMDRAITIGCLGAQARPLE